MTAQNRADNDPAAEPTLFSAMITPHRSLSGTGFLLVMALVGGLSFAGGMFFFLIGAWPVIGFLGLDVLLVYWAFRANYRAAAAYEEVTVTPSELTAAPGQPPRRGRGMDAQSALDEARPREARGVRIAASCSWFRAGAGLPVAGFLSPKEKESFADALSAALGEASRGPTRAVCV